jgi:hypothetical protein
MDLKLVQERRLKLPAPGERLEKRPGIGLHKVINGDNEEGVRHGAGEAWIGPGTPVLLVSCKVVHDDASLARLELDGSSNVALRADKENRVALVSRHPGSEKDSKRFARPTPSHNDEVLRGANDVHGNVPLPLGLEHGRVPVDCAQLHKSRLLH